MNANNPNQMNQGQQKDKSQQVPGQRQNQNQGEQRQDQGVKKNDSTSKDFGRSGDSISTGSQESDW